jgi:biopolymer transport protein ExbD
MRRTLQKHQLRLVSEISVTPLLDLVLVLLLVFMITAPLLQKSGQLELPSAAAAEPTPPSQVVKLSIDAQRTLQLDQRILTQDQLQGALEALVQQQSSLGVLIYAHRDLPVQVLVDIMDILHRSGVKKSAVATAPPAAS